MIRTEVFLGIILFLLLGCGWLYMSNKSKDEKIQELTTKISILQTQWETLAAKSDEVKRDYDKTLSDVTKQNAEFRKIIIKLQNERVPVLCPDKFIWMKEKKADFQWSE